MTVCAPDADAPQLAPTHDPFGPIVNVVNAVRSAVALPYWSRPSAVYACEPFAAMVADAGLTTMWSSGAGVRPSGSETRDGSLAKWNSPEL